MKKFCAILFSFVLVLMLALPVAAEDAAGESDSLFDTAPALTAPAGYVVNLDTNIVVYEKNSETPLSAASLTKLMTTLLLLENYQDQLDSISLTAPSYVYDLIWEQSTNASSADIRRGETQSLRNLLYAMLLPSGNEAAYIVADYMGGGSIDNFVAMMNDEAKAVGCTGTTFVDPCGLNPNNITTARDAYLILRALTRVQDCYALDLHKLQLDPAQAKSILALGVPAGLQNAIFAIANLFIQAGVNSFDSLMVKGNSAAANADGLIYDCMAAFYMACASFMSQNYGAGKLDRVKKSYFIALAYSFGLGAVLGGGLLVFGRQFLALFTTESAVIDAGMKRIMVMGWAYCTSAFMDCTIAASRGLGKTVGPTVIVILGSCVFRVAWVYTIFAHFHTIPALYLLYPCSWALTAAAEIAYFVFSYRHAALRLQERDALAQL